MMTINVTIRNVFSGLIGKRCCRQRVGGGRSLSIGFGGKIPHSKSKTVDSFYGEWEIGTYSSAWRIICNDQILCGSMNVVDTTDELDEALQRITLGVVVDIVALSRFDIRIKLDCGIFIDFIGASTDDDEMFHILGPDSLYVEYKILEGWVVGKSSTPWT